MSDTPAASRELRRSMGLPHATALVVGTIIGASIFVQPSEITGQVPTISGMFMVWLVSGVVTLCGALVCAELASYFSRTGGVYVFLRETYSPLVGFLWGWAMFWSMHSGIIAAIAVVFARYTGFFVELDATGLRVTAIAAILALSAVNYAGVRYGSGLQTLFTLGKVLAVVLMIVLGFTLGARLDEHFVPSVAAADGVRTSDFMLALIAGLFAFGGWHMVTYSAGETRNPERTIPLALAIGTVTVTASYIALNAVYLYILPMDTVIASTRVAADAAEALVGARGGGAISALVMFSTFGSLSGIVLAGPRVYYSMAQDGLIFRWMGDVHSRFLTPHKAIVMQAIVSSALVWTGTYRALFTRVIYTEWIFFAMMAYGLVLLRRRADYTPAYRVWGYPWTPLLFIVSSAAIVVNQIVTDPGESAIGLGIVALGIPVYLYWTRRR